MLYEFYENSHLDRFILIDLLALLNESFAGTPMEFQSINSSV